MHKRGTSKSITEPELSDAYLSLGIQVRYLRVPTKWNYRIVWDGPALADLGAPVTKGVRETFEPLADYGCTLLPTVSEEMPDGYGRLVGQQATVTLDPYKLRTEFFRLNVWDATAVIEFLSRAGLWELRDWSWCKTDHVGDVWAGYRKLDGQAIPTSAAEMYRVQKHYTAQLDLLGSNPEKLAKEFAPPSHIGDAMRAAESNTMPLNVEWRHGKPQGVIQIVSVMELLRTTLHVDMLTGAMPQVCERPDCRTRFTGRQRRYCCGDCARVMATRAFRIRERAPKPRKR